MRMFRQILGTLLIVVLAGCDPMRITSDYDPAADFTGLKTYDWMPVANKEGTDAAQEVDGLVVDRILDSRIRRAVENQLAIQGHQKLTPEKADFLIGYHAAVQEKLRVTTMDDHYGYGRGWRPSRRPYGGRGGYSRGSYSGGRGYSRTFVAKYDEGTLVLDIVDPKTKMLLWRASAQAEVDRDDSLEKRQKRLNEAVRRMLEDFPPQSQ